MEDYTDAQSAPISTLKGFPEGKQAIEVSEKAQHEFKNVYGPRPKDIHIIVRTKNNKPWHISARRERLIHWYPNDRMVFAFAAENITFLGWLYFKEIKENWHETPLGHEVDCKLRSMETFSA